MASELQVDEMIQVVDVRPTGAATWEKAGFQGRGCA
jgi:hypothetical protein